jgi:hypothetical protein
MRRQVHFPALAWLVVTLIGTATAMYGAWVRFSAVPTLGQTFRPRAWTSLFGDMATAILIVALPLIIWLGHKAFFSRFRP